MYKLFPCIPISRAGGGGGGIKSVKRMCMLIMLKIALVLVKIYVLVRKKGISGLEPWIVPKHIAMNLMETEIY